MMVVVVEGVVVEEGPKPPRRRSKSEILNEMIPPDTSVPDASTYPSCINKDPTIRVANKTMSAIV